MLSTVGRRREHDDKPPKRCSTPPSAPSPKRASTPSRCARWQATPARRRAPSTACSDQRTGWSPPSACAPSTSSSETSRRCQRPTSPRQDLVEVALIFRRFALEHPALFSIAFHRADPAIWPRFRGGHGRACRPRQAIRAARRRRPARRPQHLRGRPSSVPWARAWHGPSSAATHYRPTPSASGATPSTPSSPASQPLPPSLTQSIPIERPRFRGAFP